MAADTLQGRALEAPADSDRPAAADRASGAGASGWSGLGIAEVYEGHFRFVWRCLRSLGVPDGHLDDALQDVFLVVQRKLERFDGKGDLKTWLYAIALRVARRYRSRAAKDARKFVATDALGELEGEEPSRPFASGAAARTGDLERDLEHGERLDLARRALEGLDDEKREMFVLACVEQMSAPEIAQITGLPVNTVYSRIRAARLAFSARVARLEPSPSRRPR